MFPRTEQPCIGLVGYWDTVAFDEFAGKQKRVDKALVDISTSFYIPGWEVDIIRGEMFSDGYGFVMDYLAEILRSLRNHDYSHFYREHFSLLKDISTRDRTGIQKTFSGLMKILFPHEEATQAEMEELLRFAIEGRKRVKDQLMRIDATYTAVRFGYRENGDEGKVKFVKTLEEEQYARFYYKDGAVSKAEGSSSEAESLPIINDPDLAQEPQPGHRVINENQTGISFDGLFGPYLKGAKRIEITDPYLRNFYQVRNLMELLETIVKVKAIGDEVAVHVVTVQDEFNESQVEYFQQIEKSSTKVGIRFTMAFDPIGKIHARHIVTDHGWKISLDRGLDIFQRYEMKDAFDFANRLQGERPCKNFEVTYLRLDDKSGAS